MKVQFIGQPLDAGHQIGRLITSSLADISMERFWLLSAWAKRSGLGRIVGALRDFRERGGRVEAILGLDEGGASRQGLELALELFDDTYVFHDRGTRTFHPKLYVVEGEDRAVAVVGSGNLTRGGLFTNYEAAVAIELDYAVDEDADVHRDLRAYWEALAALDSSCKPLDHDMIAALAEDPAIRLQSEVVQNRRRARIADEITQSIFGDPIQGLATAPPPELEPLEYDETDTDSSIGTAEPLEAEVEFGDQEVEEHPEGFWKALSNFDASHTSAPGQIQIPIRFLDFFGPLELQRDDSDSGGVRQSHTVFPVRFVDGDFRKDVLEARAILYEPAESQPRPNKELRFTFHDRPVFERLEPNDVLRFTRDADGVVRIERVSGPPEGAGGRWGTL